MSTLETAPGEAQRPRLVELPSTGRGRADQGNGLDAAGSAGSGTAPTARGSARLRAVLVGLDVFGIVVTWTIAGLLATRRTGPSASRAATVADLRRRTRRSHAGRAGRGAPVPHPSLCGPLGRAHPARVCGGVLRDHGDRRRRCRRDRRLGSPRLHRCRRDGVRPRRLPDDLHGLVAVLSDARPLLPGSGHRRNREGGIRPLPSSGQSSPSSATACGASSGIATSGARTAPVSRGSATCPKPPR